MIHFQEKYLSRSCFACLLKKDFLSKEIIPLPLEASYFLLEWTQFQKGINV